MDIVKIGGVRWNVLVTGISENFNILYAEGTGRLSSIGAPMFLNPLGTFFGHKVTFKRRSGHEAEYDALFDFLAQPRYEGIDVDIVHGQTTLAYSAYVSSGERSVKRIDEKTGEVCWDALTVDFVPMSAQVEP